MNYEETNNSSTTSGNLSTSKRIVNFDLSKFKENMAVESPMRDGIVVDWDMLEKLWEYSLKRCGKLDCSLRDTPVLLAEKPYTTAAARHRLV